MFWVSVVYIVLGAVIYANTLHAPFHFDGKANIVENPHIRITDLTWEQLTVVGESPQSNRPVALLSFALNYYIGQYDVTGYHLVNIVIHIGNATLLYLLIHLTLGIRSERFPDPSCAASLNRHYIAIFAGMMWLVHPLHTQSVTYILQRMNSMAALFSLLTLLCYVKGRNVQRTGVRSTQGHARQVGLWFFGGACSAVLALGSKEMTATLPFFVILYEWYFYQELRWQWVRQHLGWIIGAVVAFILLSYVFLRGGNVVAKILKTYEGREFTIMERMLTELRVVFHYLSLFLYPHPSRLHLDYDFPLSHSLLQPPTTLLALGAMMALVGLAVVLAAKHERLISFGIVWFLGNLVIESSILGFELVYEHRTYLPSMFVSLIVVVLAFRVTKHARVVIGVLSAIVILFSVWTIQRNVVWNDEIVFWTHEVHAAPQSPRAHNNLGNLLMNQERSAEAIPHFRDALRVEPDYVPAHYNLAIMLERHGKPVEAIVHYREVVGLDAQHAGAHNNLGNLLDTQGETAEAIAHYRQAIESSPRYAEAHFNLALTLEALGRTDEAKSHFQEVRRLKPQLLAR